MPNISWLLLGWVVFAPSLTLSQTTFPKDLERLRTLALTQQYEELKKEGPGGLEKLAHVYEKTTAEEERAQIADAFYRVGIKSPAAKRVLMRDIHTQSNRLRLAVQWAVGRVSNDDDVVDILAENMQNDGNPLFRDKAACALASDQTHLSEKQKQRLYKKVIAAMNDSKPDVQRIALEVMRIQTGQSKSIPEWQAWIKEYDSQL